MKTTRMPYSHVVGIAMLLLTLLGLSLGCSPQPGWVPPTVRDQAANGAVVLSGKVLSTNAEKGTARVEVINYYRGCGKTKIEISGVKESSMCGAGVPTVGDAYMFYLCDGARINRFTLHAGMLPATVENKAIAKDVCGAARRPETCAVNDGAMVDAMGKTCGRVNSAMEVVPPAKSEKRQRRQLLAKLGTEDKADKRSRPAQARDLRRNRDHTAKAAMADRTKTIDACLGVIYACENYGECCGGGNYARPDHKPICTKAKPFSVGGNCRSYDTHAGEI